MFSFSVGFREASLSSSRSLRAMFASAHAQRELERPPAMELAAEEKEAEARRLRSCFVEQLQARAARE